MKIFLFHFEIAIKITGSAQNYRVGRVSGNTSIFKALVCIVHVKQTTLHYSCFCILNDTKRNDGESFNEAMRIIVHCRSTMGEYNMLPRGAYCVTCILNMLQWTRQLRITKRKTAIISYTSMGVLF